MTSTGGNVGFDDGNDGNDGDDGGDYGGGYDDGNDGDDNPLDLQEQPASDHLR